MNWWFGWGPLACLPIAALALVPSTWPRWALMWTLAITIYAGCKWLTWRRTRVAHAPLWRHVAYLTAWPGLDAGAFLDSRVKPVPKPAAREWLFALGKLAAGLIVLYRVTKMIPGDRGYLAGWTGMVGLVFVLHFGVFHLLSCAWRSAGVAARPLMNWPILSVSVSEFWGRRWNTAFRDLTHRFLFRPFAARFGARGAILAGFVFSGLVHDLVISGPAGKGFGGPSAFFAVQGLAILIERSPAGRRIHLGHGPMGWFFTAAVLIGPAAWLFHEPFVLRIILPFLRVIRAV